MGEPSISSDDLLDIAHDLASRVADLERAVHEVLVEARLVVSEAAHGRRLVERVKSSLTRP